MGYCLLSVVNICIVGIVSWYGWGYPGLGVAVGYALFIWCLPLCRLADILISHFFDVEKEIKDMLYLEKSLYLSFIIYKIILKFFMIMLVLSILVFLLVYDLIMVINSGGNYSVSDSFSALWRIYLGMAGFADRVIDSIIGTLVAVCNYIRRKRKGINLTDPYSAATFMVEEEETETESEAVDRLCEDNIYEKKIKN